MTQTIDKTNWQGNWKPKRYARIFASDQEEITEAADGGVFGTKYFAVWCKLNFAGFNSNDIYFQESLFNISKATGLDKKTIRKALSFLESRRFIEVKKGERNSAGLNESSYFKLLRNVPKKLEKEKNTNIEPEGKNNKNFPLEPEGKNESLHVNKISPVFNSSSNEESIKESIVEKNPPLKQISFKTYFLADFKQDVANFAREKGMDEVEMAKFINYWAEKDDKGKMRFQREKTWETSRRIATWIGKDFNRRPQRPILTDRKFEGTQMNFSLNRSSENSISESTVKIIQSYAAHFSKTPKGELIWIEYFERNGVITPEIAKEVFNKIAEERLRQEENSGFKNHIPPTLPEVRREIEKYLKEMARSKAQTRPQTQGRPEMGLQLQELQRAVIHPVHQVKSKGEQITAEAGAAMTREVFHNQKSLSSEPANEPTVAVTDHIVVQPAPAPQETQEKRNPVFFPIPDGETAFEEAKKKYPDLDKELFTRWLDSYRMDWVKSKRTDGTTSIGEVWLDAFTKYFFRTKTRASRPALQGLR